MSTLSSRLALLALLLLPLAAHALSAAFTYQGRLAQGGAAPTGSFDFTFTLYDAAAGGAPVGGIVDLAGVPVANGLFTVPLDFGVTPFQGEDRWLEIAVRAAGGESYTVLAPRQPLTPTPYALFARAVNWDGILNRPAAFGVYTAGAGLTLTGQEFAIANGGVGTPMLSDGAVTAGKLAADAASLAKVTGNGMAMNGTNVGIGTATAGFPLTFPNTLGEKISLWGQSGIHYGFGVQNALLQIFAAASGDSIAFGYGASAAFTERMRIRGDGNVGIGTTAPAAKLDVNGTAKMTGFQLGGSATAGQVLTANASGVGSWAALPAYPTTLPPSGAAGGDLAGTYPNPTVGTGKIDSAKILDGAIAAADLAANAVTTAKILDASVTTAKLADGAVTDAKVADVAWGKITGAPASLPPGGAAGGDLTGTYPNPAIAVDAVGNTKLAADDASLLKVSGGVMASREGGITIGPDGPVGELFQVYGYDLTPMGIEQTGSNGGYRGGADPWQSFTAVADATLQAVEMQWSAEGTDTGATLTIYAGEGTGGAVLSTQTITVAPGSGYHLYTLAAPVALTAGQVYTFGFTVAPWLYIRRNSSNAYAGGRSWYDANYDICFRLFSAVSATGAPALVVSRDTFNVGIGTGTPGFPLTFANVLGDKIALWGQSGNSFGFGIQGYLLQIHTDTSNADIAFGYGSSGAMTETLRIKGNGRVGIGTSTPDRPLTIKSSGNLWLGLRDDADAAKWHLAAYNGGINFAETNVADYRLLLAAGGNVGIGTGSPGFPLTFANALGDKISLWGQSGDHYGFGIQGNLLQIHTAGSNSDIAFGFGQSSALTETMRVKGNGRVGIGTSAPDRPLTIKSIGSQWLGLRDDADAAKWHLNAYNGGLNFAETSVADYRLLLAAGGNVGIGTGTPGYKLHVNGSVAGVGAYQNLSDARFKTHVRPLTAALTRLAKLQGVEFDWKRDGTGAFCFDDKHQLGFLAQAVEQVVPEAVTQSADGVYSMSYTTLIPLLVEGMKEQQAADDARQRQLDALQAENADLKARLAKLEALVEALGRK